MGMSWAVNVERSYVDLHNNVWKMWKRKTLGRRKRWWNSSTIRLTEIGPVVMNWIQVTKNKNHWKDLVYKIIKLHTPLGEEFIDWMSNYSILKEYFAQCMEQILKNQQQQNNIRFSWLFRFFERNFTRIISMLIYLQSTYLKRRNTHFTPNHVIKFQNNSKSGRTTYTCISVVRKGILTL